MRENITSERWESPFWNARLFLLPSSLQLFFPHHFFPLAKQEDNTTYSSWKMMRITLLWCWITIDRKERKGCLPSSSSKESERRGQKVQSESKNLTFSCKKRRCSLHLHCLPSSSSFSSPLSCLIIIPFLECLLDCRIICSFFFLMETDARKKEKLQKSYRVQ